MILLTLITKIYLLCWFFTAFEPIQQVINLIFTKIKPNFVTEAIWTILGCNKCLVFWTTLAIIMNIWIALLASFIVSIINNK